MKRLVLCALLALPATGSAAHEWYDAVCCSGRDCAMVFVPAVSVGSGGWRVRLQPGDHPLVVKSIDELIPFEDLRIRSSKDSDFHVCIRALDQKILCVYVPDMAS